jgi:hypothetical protein
VNGRNLTASCWLVDAGGLAFRLKEDAMNRTGGLLILTLLVGLASAPVLAQSPKWEAHMLDRMCASEAPADNQRGMDRLANRLKLTDAQKASLKELNDTSVKSLGESRTALCADKPNLSTTPGRMAFAQKMLEARLASMKAAQPKLQAFYDSLDDKQKAAFDNGRRMGGMFGFFGRGNSESAPQ